MSGKTIVIAFVDLVLVVAIAAAAYLAWGGGGSGNGEQEAQPGEFSAFHLTPLAESELQPGLVEPRALDRTPLSEAERQRVGQLIDEILDEQREVENQLLLAAIDLLAWSSSDLADQAAKDELAFICHSVPISVVRTTFFVSQSQVEAGKICGKVPSDVQGIDLDGYREEISHKIREEELNVDPGQLLVALSRGVVNWATSYHVRVAPSDDYVDGICLRVPESGFDLRSSPPFGEPYASADAALVAICIDRREGRVFGSRRTRGSNHSRACTDPQISRLAETQWLRLRRFGPLVPQRGAGAQAPRVLSWFPNS